MVITMKKNIKISVFCMAGLLALASCRDGFLEEKKNYDNGSADIYNYYSGCDGRVNDVYRW